VVLQLCRYNQTRNTPDTTGFSRWYFNFAAAEHYQSRSRSLVAVKLKNHQLKQVVSPVRWATPVAVKLKDHRLKQVVSYTAQRSLASN
jgi:hypothetical protein